MTNRRTIVLVAIILLLSGCGGVQDRSSPATTEVPGENPSASANDTTRESTVTGDDGVSVRGGTLPVNATAVFRNVLTLTDVDAHRPVIVIENGTAVDGDRTSALVVDDFGNALGLTPPEDGSAGGRPGGFTDKNTVYVVPNNGSEPELERVLAHEFVHVLQYQKEWQSHLLRSNASVDANRILRGGCLSEGSATYVADEYVQRYSVDAEPNTALVRDGYLDANGTGKYFYGMYYFCSRYIHSRLDSPTNLTDVYRDPPVTTEQVIHNYTPREELPKELDVSVNETNASWSLWDDSTKGELFTRVALADVLPEEDAARAAAGWGNDRLLEFRNGERQGYVWVLRWDSANDTDQFVQSFERYLAARGAGPDNCLGETCFEQRRLGPQTSAVLVGPNSFPSNVTIDRENATVGVRPP